VSKPSVLARGNRFLMVAALLRAILRCSDQSRDRQGAVARATPQGSTQIDEGAALARVRRHLQRLDFREGSCSYFGGNL